MKKVFKRFNIDDVKPASTPLLGQFRLFKDQSPVIEDEIAYIYGVPYSFLLDPFVRDICTRSDNANEVGVFSSFMSNLKKKHWKVVE